MSIKIASMNFGDCDTILHNTPNGMKNIAEVLGPNGEVYWTSTKELTGVPPLSIKSNGTPLLDYLISGNMSQSGTPTPDNPIQPQECGDLETTGTYTGQYKIPISSGGQNLFDMSFYEGESGITVSGNKATGKCDRFFNVKISIPPELYGQELTWSAYLKRPDNPNTVRLQTVDNGSYKYGNNIAGEGRSTVSFTATSTIKLYVNYANTGSDTIELSDIMLNLGATALPYEPYNRTTTPVYLGEVQSARRIKKLVLDGTENWVELNVYYTVPAPNVRPWTGCVCTHCAYQGIIGGNSNTRLWVQQASFPNYQTLADFKAYLAQQYANGTPVTVWYSTATPETGILNEPLRKIGNYADTVSYEQTQVSIPTVSGTTIIDVDTTLKPSQMYIKYK